MAAVVSVHTPEGSAAGVAQVGFGVVSVFADEHRWCVATHLWLPMSLL